MKTRYLLLLAALSAYALPTFGFTIALNSSCQGKIMLEIVMVAENGKFSASSKSFDITYPTGDWEPFPGATNEPVKVLAQSPNDSYTVVDTQTPHHTYISSRWVDFNNNANNPLPAQLTLTCTPAS